jgi:phosphatidylserine/phosphatidylglycerophosphate/cardiolipin synthase-like enzyme
MTRPDIVENVSSVMEAVWDGTRLPVDAINMEPDYQLLIYWGEFNKSRIYEETIRFIGETKEHLSIGSQYVVDHNVLKEIRSVARRGAKVDLYTSPLDHNKFNSMPHVMEYLRSLRTICEEPNILLFHHPTTEMHLKAMMRDGKAAMWGSHNFVWMGMFLATAEIAMLTEDPALVYQFVQFFSEIDRHASIEQPHRYQWLYTMLSHPLLRNI